MATTIALGRTDQPIRTWYLPMDPLEHVAKRKDTAKDIVAAMGGKADAKTVTAAINARMKG